MDRPVDIISLKRDGGNMTAKQMEDWIEAYVGGEVADYQMAAWCMAVYFNGLTVEETLALTRAMVDSGDRLDLAHALGRRIVDKHSTGGVGDKTSLVVGPIVASCGVPFAKMSGRGLGHTGGTLDKLESIPGFRADLSQDEFITQARDTGLVICGTTGSFVPADKLLYALRDVTATVDSLPLIAASVMSKKIASGANAVVIDVKVGDGAFMRRDTDAQRLAKIMQEIGRDFGVRVTCILTDMDQPLGKAVGNALEIEEVEETLQDRGPDDLVELACEISGQLLAASDLGLDLTQGREQAAEALRGGRAFEAYKSWIVAQGGAADTHLPQAPIVLPVYAARDGYVLNLSARAIGQTALRLGAGRKVKGDQIDHAVGIRVLSKRGDKVSAGQTIAEVYARDKESGGQAQAAVLSAYDFSAESVPHKDLIRQILD